MVKHVELQLESTNSQGLVSIYQKAGAGGTEECDGQFLMTPPIFTYICIHYVNEVYIKKQYLTNPLYPPPDEY